MATAIPMGIVSLKAEGAYAADKLYKKGMWVTSSGSSYAYINPIPAAGVPVTDTSHWQQIASKGDIGPSAYDAAVAGGYTGTEAEFNADNAGIEAAARFYAGYDAQLSANINQMNSVQSQVDVLVVEGDSSVEAAQARVDEKGAVYTTLKDRLDVGDRYAHVTEDAIKRSPKFYAKKKNQNKAFVTFIDDDGRTDVLTKLLPLFSGKGVPLTVATCLDNTFYPDASYLTFEQLKTLQDTYGFEIANHTKNHVRLDLIAGDALYDQVVGSYVGLSAQGLKIDTVVYPFGSILAEGAELASAYHSCGFIAGGGRVELPIKNSFSLRRIPFGTEGDTLQTYKDHIDAAIASNGWCVFMIHCWYPAFDAVQQQWLSDLIDYCLASEVSVVNARDGYANFGNRVEYQDALVVSNEGIQTSLIPSTDYTIISDNTVKSDTPLTYFKPYSETITKIHTSLGNTEGFPINNGILRTLMPGFNGGTSYAAQILTSHGDKGAYYRAVKTLQGEWSPFYRIGLPSSIIATTDTEIILPGNGYKAFNVTVSPLTINTTTPFIVTPKTSMNSEIIYSAKRSTGSVVTITLHNLVATERNLGVMEWVVKVLE